MEVSDQNDTSQMFWARDETSRLIFGRRLRRRLRPQTQTEYVVTSRSTPSKVRTNKEDA